jgi:pseudouridine kinase
MGGANTDYVGTPHAVLAERVSNPGSIRTSPGGVGRNVAENLTRLGVEVELITAFGDDESARELAASCREAGIGIGASLFVEGAAGARYLAINDTGHDLAVGVSDMRVLEALTPAELASPERMRLIASADVVVADANLQADSLRWISRAVTSPLVIDPVSAEKARRVAPLLSGLAAIKPNAQEVEALIGMRVSDLRDAEQAARDIVRRGTRAAFVTLGSLGVAWADYSASGSLRSPGVNPVNTSGAGDAFTAGIVYAMLSGADAATRVRFASALSTLALASNDTVNPEVSCGRATALMAQIYGQGTR